MGSSASTRDYDSVSEEELSREWCAASREYVNAVNAFLEKKRRNKGINNDLVPQDRRSAMAHAVMRAVRHSNENGTVPNLRERFPPAHKPFIEMLDENGRVLPAVLLLNDGRILVQVGDLGVQVIDGDQVKELPDIHFVGRSANRRYFAVGTNEGIEIHDAWDGPCIARLAWPTGFEELPHELKIPAREGVPFPKSLMPFPEGDRVLLVSTEGVFVIGSNSVRRLLPTLAEIRDYVASSDPSELAERRPYDCFDLHMVHAAISPDGRWVACGHQGSDHLLFDANTCEPVASLLPRSSYPDFAAFSRDGSTLAVNSCHWYNGMTLGVPISALVSSGSELSPRDQRVVVLDDDARVYASAYCNDEFIIGDAHGFLRAVDWQGRFRWEHFIGSTIDAIDIAPDGKRMVVTSCAGFLCILDLDTGTRDPYTIGTATHRELRRWLFWKKERQPLIW